MSYQDGWIVFDNDLNKLLTAHKANGVFDGWSVSESDTPAMSVKVAAGSGFVNELCRETTSPTTVDLDASDSTNPRKDIIIVNSAGTITKVTGSPEAAEPSGETGPKTSKPKPANIPTNAIIIAEVWVAAGATAIYNASITDRRIILPRIFNALELMAAYPIIHTPYNQGSISYDGNWLKLQTTVTGQFPSICTGYGCPAYEATRNAYFLRAEMRIYFAAVANSYFCFFEPRKAVYNDFQGYHIDGGTYYAESRSGGTETQTTITDQDWSSPVTLGIKHEKDQTDMYFYVDKVEKAHHTTNISAQPYCIHVGEPNSTIMSIFLRYPPGIRDWGA